MMNFLCLYFIIIMDLNVTLDDLAMTNSMCLFGHVLRKPPSVCDTARL